MLLKFAVKEFLAEKEFQNLSPASISAYRFTLKGFAEFCAGRQIFNVAEVTIKDIREYLRHCREECGNGPVSLNHKLNNLRIFFKHMISIEAITQNPAEGLKPLRTDVRIETLTDQHIRLILGYFQRQRRREKTFYAYRDYMIVVILLGTGMRLGELVNLEWDHVGIENGGTITVYGKKRELSSIPLIDKLKKELLAYRSYCEKIIGHLPQHVITTRAGAKVTEGAVKCVFKRLKKNLGLSEVRLSPHTFRHTFAQRYILAGGDAFSLQRILRHSNISTTMRYVNLWGTALKEQNDRFNPLVNINI